MQRYVYGIIRAETVLEFDVEGLGKGAPKPQSYPLGDGLAMVSTSFSGEQIRPSRRNMLTHTKVLEHVMQGHDVLPIRFGTVLPDAEEGQAMLRANKAQFLKAFDDVGGCHELSLKIIWRDGIAFQEVIDADDALRAARDALAQRDPRQSHYERIEFGKQVEAAIAAKREKEAKELRMRLQHLCTDFAEGAVSDDVMIANFSMLVTPEQEAQVDKAVNLLDDVHGERLTFRYVGPMPPFTFVELKIDPARPVSVPKMQRA
ncbi:MAG: GvpL/GvpF family gas vesicle protein [Pseudomonadota bacterium]